ncbi:MAG: PH domain-containing protein [bacterium]|nr:PH domain-containing protein [bacterium]
MGLMDKIGGNIMQGLMGNLSEVTPEKLTQDYGMYLMDGEVIHTGFVLVRDVVIFTDKRIIDLDKQGATGQKARVSSIYLDSIINVSAETAGFGLDDSELNIEFISSPYFKANGGVSISSRKFEFPKKYQIQGIYKWLQETAYTNHLNINK